MSDGGGGRGITMVALHRDISQPSRWTMTSSIGTTLIYIDSQFNFGILF